MSSGIQEKRSLNQTVHHGVAWNAAFQVVNLLINFGVMLVLARIIAPAEHGLAAAASGIIGLINSLNCSCFIAHAVNQTANETPDWSLHWHAAHIVQLLLTVALNLIACVLHWIPNFSSIAILLHVGSLGLLIDTPNQIALAQMRRAMDFRLLRKLQLVCGLLTAGVAVTGGLLGWGALALILGANVAHGIPLGWHLVFIKKWRPSGGWFQLPDWKRYGPSRRFGFQLFTASILEKGRTALESILLPGLFGFSMLGLWNRAQVLLTTTGGRLTLLLVETIYPLLPRSRHDPAQFARHTSLFLRGTILFLLPSTAFILLHGDSLLILLYGPAWAPALPYLSAATIFVAGATVNSLFSIVLLAADRARTTVYIQLIVSFTSVVALGMAFSGHSAFSYVWTAAVGQWIGALVVFRWVAPHLEPQWFRTIFLPPLVALLAAAGGSTLFGRTGFHSSSVFMGLLIHGILFAVIFILAMRLLFTKPLASIVHRMPFHSSISRVLWLPA